MNSTLWLSPQNDAPPSLHNSGRRRFRTSEGKHLPTNCKLLFKGTTPDKSNSGHGSHFDDDDDDDDDGHHRTEDTEVEVSCQLWNGEYGLNFLSLPGDRSTARAGGSGFVCLSINLLAQRSRCRQVGGEGQALARIAMGPELFRMFRMFRQAMSSVFNHCMKWELDCLVTL